MLFAEDFGLTEREAARWCLFSAGLWWAVFTVIPMLRLVNRPPYHVVAAEGWVVTAGFRQLGRTLRELVTFKITVLFLVAYLLYNDGIQAAIAFAATFGSEELGFDDEILIGAILLVQIVAFFGALALGRIAARKGAKATVLGALVVWAAVVAYAFVIPAGNVPLFFLLAAAIGFVLGGSQALSRSLFSHLIPGGREAEYYAVYEVVGPRDELHRIADDHDRPADHGLLPAGDPRPRRLLHRRWPAAVAGGLPPWRGRGRATRPPRSSDPSPASRAALEAECLNVGNLNAGLCPTPPRRESPAGAVVLYGMADSTGGLRRSATWASVPCEAPASGR